jgi:hypothetical protein
MVTYWVKKSLIQPLNSNTAAAPIIRKITGKRFLQFLKYRLLRYYGLKVLIGQ